jgi:hypothetical protein
MIEYSHATVMSDFELTYKQTKNTSLEVGKEFTRLPDSMNTICHSGHMEHMTIINDSNFQNTKTSSIEILICTKQFVHNSG